MLTRWDPFSEMNRLHDALARRPEFRPAVDIHESEEAFTLFVEVPGMKAEDVHVDVEKNVLTIKGERNEDSEITEEGFRRIERFRGTFSRSFTLPQTVDDEAIDAKLDNGVLKLVLPKRNAPGARRIAVN